MFGLIWESWSNSQKQTREGFYCEKKKETHFVTINIWFVYHMDYLSSNQLLE
jgi:hypothetical protein